MFQEPPAISTRTIFLTAIAMIAFAANSLLCRMALGGGLIDPTSFTAIRICSGALILVLLLSFRRGVGEKNPLDWRATAALFGYMIFFSFAYLSLAAGTGALILFGSVQLTMFLSALRSGERFPALSWIGLGLAFAGLVYLVSPGVTAPNFTGAALMCAAGICWGIYSLLGRHVSDPLQSTARNFLYSVPLVLGISLVFLSNLDITVRGAALAVASGALASGLGYAIWYTALAGLTATRAATIQLSVPAIAAFGGVLLLSETVTLRLVLASLATLCGVAIVLAQRAAQTK